MWSWKDCTSQNYRALFSFRLSWLCTTKKTVRNNGQTSYLRLKTAVKLHIDQMMRTRNFRVRNDVVEREAVTQSQKGKKAYVERKVEECFQWKAHGQCSKGDSWSSSHDTTASGNSGKGQRRKGRSSFPHPKRRQRLTVKKATEMKVLTREVRFNADAFFFF